VARKFFRSRRSPKISRTASPFLSLRNVCRRAFSSGWCDNLHYGKRVRWSVDSSLARMGFWQHATGSVNTFFYLNKPLPVSVITSSAGLGESRLPAPQTQLAFHWRVQRNASPVRVHGCNTAPAPTGFAQFVSEDFPILQLFKTTCGAGLLASSCALTFCSPAVSVSICFCWRAIVASCSSFLECSLRNSLSNIAFTAS
jgi:hypothetical protein